MPRAIHVADRAIANAALTELLIHVEDQEGKLYPAGTATAMAAEILDAASKVKFQPSTRQLVLTFDLDMSAPEQPTSGFGGS
jgi:hypothetical protein